MDHMDNLPTATPTDTECPICHDTFDEPKILPCIHRLCRKCLGQWLSRDKTSCPICRADISEGSPSDLMEGTEVDAIMDTLPTDLALMNLLKCQKDLQGTHECVTCDDPKRPALFLCVDCNDKFCADCAKFHSKLSLARDHKLQSLSELTAKHLARSYHGSCPAHSQRVPELYCPAHETVVCLLCSFADHGGCNPRVVKIDVRVQEVRRDMTEMRDKLKMAEASYKELANKYDDLLQELHHKRNDAKEKIDVSFDSLQRALDTRRKNLKADVDALADKEEAALVKSKNDSLNCQSRTLAHWQLWEEMLTTTADVTLIAMASEMKGWNTKLETLITVNNKAKISVIPTFELDKDLNTRLEQNISQLGNVTTGKQMRCRPEEILEEKSEVSSPYAQRWRPKEILEEKSYAQMLRLHPWKSEERSVVESKVSSPYAQSEERSVVESKVSSPYSQRCRPEEILEEKSEVASHYAHPWKSEERSVVESKVSSPYAQRCRPEEILEEKSEVSSPYAHRCRPEEILEEKSKVSSPYAQPWKSEERSVVESKVSSPYAQRGDLVEHSIKPNKCKSRASQQKGKLK